MPTNDVTTNYSFQKPHSANLLSYDVGRIRSALDSIDTQVKASEIPTQTNQGGKFLTTNGAALSWGAVQSSPLTATETVTIGSGETYETINAALAAYSTKIPQYLNTGVRVILNLKAGFVMAEQVLVDGLNLGWITITGADNETTITRSALTIDPANTTEYPAFFVQNGGCLPVIDQLFTMNTSGTATNRHGIYAVNCGNVVITSGAGVKSAAGVGLYAAARSSVSSSGGVFSGAGDYGVVSEGGSVVYIPSGNARKGGIDNSNDFAVFTGGMISAHSATGGKSVTVNTISTHGIIFA